MNNVTWPYLAGFIDGDGWITSHKNNNCGTRRYYVGVCQEAIHESSLLLMAEFLRSHGIRVSVIHRISRVRADQREVAMVDLRIGAAWSVRTLLTNTEPFMVIKRPQAIEAIAYTTRRMELRGINATVETPSYGKWTDDEDATLRRLQADGYTNPAIGKALGRTDIAVGRRLNRLGVIRSRNVPCHGDVLLRLVAELEVSNV